MYYRSTALPVPKRTYLSSDLLDEDVKIYTFSRGMKIPSKVTSPEEWLLGFAAQEGMYSWDEVQQCIEIPKQRLIVSECSTPFFTSPFKPIEMLRTALILSKCSATHYNPESVSILTKRRLMRKIKLHYIDLGKYYGME